MPSAASKIHDGTIKIHVALSNAAGHATLSEIQRAFAASVQGCELAKTATAAKTLNLHIRPRRVWWELVTSTGDSSSDGNGRS
eukprot:SAG31_NODE_1678_length_7548_cov_16.675393_1_plen_83_part_00